MFLDRKMVSETSPSVYGTDAAELGFAPGSWPEVMETNLGNKLPLYITKLNSAGATYEQDCGSVKVIVWND